MPKPTWKFRRMTPGEINSNPVQDEFFSNEALDSLGDALVRETVQNSLDAGVPGEKVRVQFKFRDGQRDDNERGLYLDGLEPHLRARGSGLTSLPDLQGDINILVVEDFGTRGLEGDPEQNDDQDDGGSSRKNDFYYFWRNVGISAKGEGDRGRWGLGKTVFPAASRINSIFAITRRKSDGKTLLMGQSVLKTHRIDGLKHYPYGWYGLFQTNDFALPIRETNVIDHFSRQFGITRTREPGLSVVIPFPDNTITPQQIINATIGHYFFPILANDLVIEIESNGVNNRIDSKTIDNYISQMEKSNRRRWSKETLEHLFELVRWGINRRDDEYHLLKGMEQGKKPEWSDTLFKQETLDSIRERFDSGEPLAFRIPLAIQKKSENIVNTQFDVWIERDSKLDRAEDHFIREGITIPGVSTLKGKGVRAIVIARDKVLSTFLGDAENPSHTEWQERSPKFKDRYDYGPSCLRFVKNSPREIFNILSKPCKSRENNLLDDIFSAPRKKAARGKKETGEIDIGGKLPASRWLNISSIAGGFKISGNAGNGETALRGIHIKVAYEIRRGNPFAKYSPYDFSLDEPPIATLMSGCRVHQALKNQMAIEIFSPVFHCEVRGFDENRDIRVEAKPISVS